MKKSISAKEYERRLNLAKEKAGKAWCGEKTSSKIMDVELAEEFAKILVDDREKTCESIIGDMEALKYKLSPVEEKIKGANWFVKRKVNDRLDRAIQLVTKLQENE